MQKKTPAMIHKLLTSPPRHVNSSLFNNSNNPGLLYSMTPIIKSYISSSTLEIENYKPETDLFCINLQLFIGPKEGEGEESFQVQICSPSWLLNNLGADEIMFGKGMIFTKEFNWLKIKEKIDNHVANIKGENWQVISYKLSQFAFWEFENYVE